MQGDQKNNPYYCYKNMWVLFFGVTLYIYIYVCVCVCVFVNS